MKDQAGNSLLDLSEDGTLERDKTSTNLTYIVDSKVEASSLCRTGKGGGGGLMQIGRGHTQIFLTLP